MKPHIFLIATLMIISSGCINSDVLTESSTVLHLNVVTKGDYSHPIIDSENTTRYAEELRLLKQHRYDEVADLPYISGEVFYKSDKISYFTSKTYKGPDTYEFTIVFKDNKPIPQSSDEALVVLIRIVDSNGQYIAKEYISVRWP